MERIITNMLESYERGKVSRRQLIQGLAAIAAAAPAAAAASSPFKGVGLNHIALRATDVPRARDFYQKLLGLPVVRESQNDCFLGLGKNFMAIFRNQTAGMDHYCIAIENYKVESVVEELKRQGLTPRRQGNRVYFPDPDGLTVQFSAMDHGPET